MIRSRTLAIVIAVVLAHIVAFTVFLNLGRHHHNATCSACHAMRDAAQRLKLTPHRNRDCSQCHRPVPRLGKMFVMQLTGRRLSKDRKIGDKLRISNQCRACHAPMWKKEYIFQDKILFSHQRHAKRAPDCMLCHPVTSHPTRYVSNFPVSDAVCRDCHARRHVLAGPRPPRKVPDLRVYDKQPHPANWIIDHRLDGAKPNRNCAKCHKEEFCKNCHTRFLLHPANWRAVHGAVARNDLAACQVCHRPEGCIDCHSNRLPKSHGPGWVARHSKDLNVKTCLQCHDLNFCKSCHSRSRPTSHTDVMIRNHAGMSKGKEQVCAICHDQNPCQSCHKIAMPHPRTWLALHPREYKPSDAAVCANCHEQKFCLACHSKKLPASHRDRSEWARSHGQSALRRFSDCSACHAEHFCISCHNLPMPHPKDWPTLHGREAALKPGVCSTCHEQKDCAACHSGAKGMPASHRDKSIDFTKRHGELSRRRGADCRVCHDPKTFCQNCHGLPMPHPAGFLNTHRAVVKDKGEKTCATCHKKEFCSDCHKHRAKHKPGWINTHGAVATQDAKSCLTCHEPTDCLACHKKPVAGAKNVHPDCTFCHDDKTMKFTGTDTCAGCHDDVAKQIPSGSVKTDCTLCHQPHVWKPQANLCAQCHDMKKAGLHEKSDHALCKTCHNPHTWKPTSRDVCLKCHQDKKDHNAPELCWTCHPFK